MFKLQTIALLVGLLAGGLSGTLDQPEPVEPDYGHEEAKYTFDLLDEGAYGLNVDGQWTVGPGPDSIPWGIWFADSEAIMLADIQPTDPDSRTFTENWTESNSAKMRQLAFTYLGDEVESAAPFKEEPVDTVTLYGIDYVYTRGDTTYYVTACYRFCETYTLELISIDPDSGRRSREAARNAAESFEDMGGPAHMRTVRPEVMMGGENWPWPYLHNPFAISQYYMDIESPRPPSEERKKTDYEIWWKDKGMEILVRAVMKKESGPVLSSDLDRITKFGVIGWLGDFYRVSTNERMIEIPRAGIDIQTIEDVKEFKNLVDLDIELQEQGISDVSVISSMTGLTRLSLIVSPELEDLEFLRPLTDLEQLMMWGGYYPKVTDLSPLKDMTKLESLMLVAPSVTEADVLAGLPNLKLVYLNCSPDVNLEPLVQAEQIESLMVNAETIR